jgi:hypothetical protein
MEPSTRSPKYLGIPYPNFGVPETRLVVTIEADAITPPFALTSSQFMFGAKVRASAFLRPNVRLGAGWIQAPTRSISATSVSLTRGRPCGSPAALMVSISCQCAPVTRVGCRDSH